jgi:hypothetical protein
MKKIIILTLFALCALPALAMSDIPGCMDSEALNYNELATVDDGSCVARVFGCTDPRMSNYNSEANTDDGSCRIFPSYNIRPEVVTSSIVMSGGIGGVTFSFRTNQFMSCGLLISQSSNLFALNTDGVPTLNGWQALGSSGEWYGYNKPVSQEVGNWTYHQLGVPLEKGNYFIRILCHWGDKPILGPEKAVTIK